jgi:hypothetical protein
MAAPAAAGLCAAAPATAPVESTAMAADIVAMRAMLTRLRLAFTWLLFGRGLKRSYV